MERRHDATSGRPRMRVLSPEDEGSDQPRGQENKSMVPIGAATVGRAAQRLNQWIYNPDRSIDLVGVDQSDHPDARRDLPATRDIKLLENVVDVILDGRNLN